MTPPPPTRRYASNSDLPGSVSKTLSASQQSRYREAYNDAWNTYSKDSETAAKGRNAETRAQHAHEAGLKAAKMR